MATTYFRFPTSRLIRTLAFLFVGCTVATMCWLAAGWSLDLFIGSVLLVGIVAPAISVIQNGFWKSAEAVIGILAGVSLIWWLAVPRGVISYPEWLACVLVLTSFLWAIFSATHFLLRLRITPVVASSIITLINLAWLTWPVWWRGSGPTAIHPLFAINSACARFGIWTEQPIAYRLTGLGQDVAYRLPASIWPAVLFHASLAFVFVVFSTSKMKRR